MITPIRRGQVCAGYSNHSDLAADQWGNLYGAITRNDPGKASELLICRRQHGTGVPATIAIFPAVGGIKYGYCSIAVVGAHLVVWASERQLDGTTPQWEYLLPNAVTEFAPAEA